jgi:hypothetical protein
MTLCRSSGDRRRNNRGLFNLTSRPQKLVHLDILLEEPYFHLECLLKKNANASNCCKELSTC